MGLRCGGPPIQSKSDGPIRLAGITGKAVMARAAIEGRRLPDPDSTVPVQVSHQHPAR